MRYRELTELAGVKQFNDMTASEILGTIGKTFGQGRAKVLGQGANGAAVQIGEQVYKFWMQDSAYTDFVNYCLANKGNPFLPVFHSNIKRFPAFFIRHEDAPDYVNYVKMEKLSPVTGSFHNFYYQIPMQFTDEDDEDENGHLAGITLTKVIEIFESMGNSEIPATADFVSRLSKSNGHQYQFSDFSKELQLLIKTLGDIMNLGRHFLDLFSTNFMMRGNQLVILDPIANRDDTKINHMFAKFDEKLWRDDDEGKPAVSSKTKRTK